MSRAKYWAFTVNNYDGDTIARIKLAAEGGKCVYVVFGKEVGDSGTPHLQGTVVFAERQRLSQCVALLGQAHYTICRNLEQSIVYCKKDNDFFEFGIAPVQKRGKRNDLEAFKDAVKSGTVDLQVLRETHSSVMSRCHRFCLSYVRDHKPLPAILSHTPKFWQQALVDKLSGDPDPRVIHFVVDKEGNTGKSWLCAYLERNLENVQVMKCGKRDDMAFELDETLKVLVIDVARSAAEYMNYQFLEDVKDGRVFSPKYESYTKRFPAPHVVVMLNQEPDYTKLSMDRFDVIEAV